MQLIKLIIFTICCLFLLTVQSQCPASITIYESIKALRNADSISIPAQINYLKTYQKQLEACGGTRDSTYAHVLYWIGKKYAQSADFINAVRFTRQSLSVIENNRRSPSIKERLLVSGYAFLSEYNDSLGQDAQRNACIDSCIALAIRTNSFYEFALAALAQKVRYLLDDGDYHSCLANIHYAETFIVNRLSSFDIDAYADYFFFTKIKAQIGLEIFDEAEKSINKKLLIEKYSLSNNSLGLMYNFLGQIALEKKYFEKSILQFKKSANYYVIDANDIYLVSVFSNIGLIYCNYLHNPAIGLKYYYKALTHADATEALNIWANIGSHYVIQQQYKLAFAAFQKAFDQLKSGINENELLEYNSRYLQNTNTEYLSYLVLEKADAYLHQFKHNKSKAAWNAAMEGYRNADRLLTLIKERQSGTASKLFWRKHTRRLYERAIEACYLAGQPNLAFYFFEKSRAVLLGDQLNEQRRLDTDAIVQQSQLKKKILRLENSVGQLSPTGTENVAIQKELFTTRQQLSTLQQRLKNTNPLYYNSTIDTTLITVDDIKKSLLSNQQSLLELYRGDSAVYCFVITQNTASLTKINRRLYDSLSALFSNYLAHPQTINDDYKGFSQTAHYLFQLLFNQNPISKGRLIISPDGTYLPFEALLTQNKKGPPAWLLYDYAISYTYAARYLFTPRTTSKKAKDFMGMAPVIYNTGLQLSPLQGSDASLQTIEKPFRSSSIVTKNDATRFNFLSGYHKYKAIQLYTHASDSGSSGEPVIYFTDSALSLSELLPETKPLTQLVVLSACETGLGKHYEGEGIFSLNRGFASLGIPSVVMNIWAVDNQSTYRLIENFYGGLSNQLPLDVALQQAKIAFIQSASKEKQLPYYWAGTLLTGDSAPITFNQSFNLLYLILPVLLVVIGCVVFATVIAKRKRGFIR